MNELQFFQWRYKGGYQSAGRCHRVWRNEEFGIQAEMIAQKGKTETFYYIDGDKREFRSEADLVGALWVDMKYANQMGFV